MPRDSLFPGVWCRSMSLQHDHLILDGRAACGARKLRFEDWRLVLPEDLDPNRQCSRCKHHLPPAPTPLGAGPAALETVLG